MLPWRTFNYTLEIMFCSEWNCIFLLELCKSLLIGRRFNLSLEKKVPVGTSERNFIRVSTKVGLRADFFLT